jgi:hypothetical protein
MFFNASSDAASVDFYLDGALSASALASGTGSDFALTDPQDRDVSVHDAGTTTEYDLILQTFARNKHYVLSNIGLVNFGGEFEKRLRLVATEVDRHLLNGSKARLVIFHAFSRASGFQTPNIDFQNPGNNPQYKAGNIEFATSSVMTIDAGVRTFEARRAGTEEVFATLTNYDFGVGRMYLVFVMGVEGGAGAQTPQIVVKEIPTKDYS